jgi:voltage-gated potassium channel
MEQAAHFLLMRRGDAFARVHPNWWLFCIAPPARLCARHRRNKQLIWFPRWGWQIVDRALQRRLERAFSVPMICIALLILPVLGLQAYYSERIVAYPVLNAFLHFGTGLIWFAFAVEFIVMVSVAERRLDYCRKHWLDLIIILLPLVSFLRTLSFARASRLIKLGKLQQVTRLVRVYRVRGVAMRGFRALLLLEIVHRLLRTDPKKRIKKLEEKYNEKLHELEILRHDIEQLRRKIEH